MRGRAVLLGAGFKARPRVAFLCAPGPGEKARRGAGAGSNAGPKGQCGPGGLRSRVATESRASRADAARGRLRSALARRRPPRSEFLAPGTSRVRRVLGVPLRLLGNGESREAPRGSRPGKLVKTSVAMEPTVRAASRPGFRNRTAGPSPRRNGGGTSPLQPKAWQSCVSSVYRSWSASVSQTTDCRRLPRPA